jgi:hypothetical protein
MSWLFSQALVEEYSAGTSLAGAPSAQLNVTPTQHKFWRNDKTMDASDLSRFGLTLRLLTDAHGEELLTSFLAASRARTSASPAPEMGLTASVAVYGNKCGGLLARFDHASSSWRTAQCSFLEGLDEYSETWPRWGMTRSGASYLLPTPALRMCVNASGLWPTPTASLGTKGGRITPRKGREGGTLIEAVAARMYPTPAARDYRSPNKKTYAERGGGTKGEQLPNFVGGLLNPTWVEWLMGWPIGWTELKPLAMARFHEWQQQHGPCSTHEQQQTKGTP